MPRTFLIPHFEATFNPDLTISETGENALDTLVTVYNDSSVPTFAHVSVFSQPTELLALDFTIAVGGLDVQTYSVASMLRGDPRALPCPHSSDPKHGPFPLAFLQQVLCHLDSSTRHHEKTLLEDLSQIPSGIIKNPIHGCITIDQVDSIGLSNGIRVEYYVFKPGANPEDPADLQR